MNPMEIAKTIKSQIGGRSLYMLGATKLVAIGPQSDTKASLGGLQFRTGRVAAGEANVVRVELTADDTYTMTFHKLWGRSNKQLAKVKGVYCDQLNQVIELHTGLYTSL